MLILLFLIGLIVGLIAGYFLGMYLAAWQTMEIYRQGKLMEYMAERVRNARRKAARRG